MKRSRLAASVLSLVMLFPLALAGCGKGSDDAGWNRLNDRKDSSEFMTGKLVPMQPPCQGWTLTLTNANDKDHTWYAQVNDDTDFAHGKLTKDNPGKEVPIPVTTDPSKSYLDITVRNTQTVKDARVYFHQHVDKPAACPSSKPSGK